MKPKVTDAAILREIKILDQNVRKDFEARGFQEGFNPGHRREVIQARVCLEHDVTYSDGGFRNRLKKLVKQGVLRKFRIGEGMNSKTYYKLKNPSAPLDYHGR